MLFVKRLAIASIAVLALVGCDNGDGDGEEEGGFSQSNIWGVWEADVLYTGAEEVQGVEVLISEDRILQKSERVLNAETKQILVENDFTCLGYGELSIEDEEVGIFNFYWVENLSYPSRPQDNIRVELHEGGMSATVSTKVFNSDGTESFFEYEVVRTSSEVPNIDETSCVSQELSLIHI